jgi:predicted transcriptional regulator
LCRECGGWFRVLGQHLRGAHGVSTEQYRRRYGLDPHERRARELGYDTLEALLVATVHLNGADFAALLETSPREARVLRQRHGHRTPRGRTAAPDLTPRELDGLPLGQQPERDGKLLCRECGRWYRGLSQHLPHKHDVAPAEYRERYGLAATHCLQAGELHDKRVASSRARWEDGGPEWQQRLQPKMGRQAQLVRAQAARRATAERPGTRARMKATGDRLARVLPERTRAEFEARARELSFDSVEQLLAATAHLTGEALAELLGVAAHRARSLRVRHGYPSGRSGVPPANAEVPPAALTDTRLTCLECGQRYQFVAKHAAAAHGLRPEEYRRRHGLPVEVALHPLTAPSPSSA